jgi:hypothetical protein
MPSPTIAGEPLELVDRLMYVADRSPEHDPDWWLRLGIFLSVAVGCTGALAPPRERQRAMTGIRKRIEHLVGAGVDEAFLVGALRDLLDNRLSRLADVGGSESRADETRAVMQQAIDDPAELADFRRRLPSLEHLTDDDVRQKLRKMLTESLRPIDADGAVERWRVHEDWTALRAEWLSNEDLERWTMRNWANERT